jgi:hypothetical protein
MPPYNFNNVTHSNSSSTASLVLAEPTRIPPYKTLNKFTTQNSTWSLVAWFLQGQWKNNPATNTLLSGHEAIFLVM